MSSKPNIPGYRIERELGSGASARVYLAEQIRLARQVALKVLSPGLFDAEETRGRFLREARIQANLVHPALLGLYDAGFAGNVPYLAFELVEGGSLRERLGRVPIPIPEALRIGAEIAGGLAAAHESGIVHRDLKPENVLLTPEGAVKIADFGLAKAAAGRETVRTAEGVILGTPGYLAPEVIEGADAGAPADVYALGVVLFELLAGRKPFEGGDAGSILARQVSEEPPAPSTLRPGISRRLDRVVLACLDRRPASRPSPTSRLASQLESLRSAANAAPGDPVPVSLERAEGASFPTTHGLSGQEPADRKGRLPTPTVRAPAAGSGGQLRTRLSATVPAGGVPPPIPLHPSASPGPGATPGRDPGDSSALRPFDPSTLRQAQGSELRARGPGRAGGEGGRPDRETATFVSSRAKLALGLIAAAALGFAAAWSVLPRDGYVAIPERNPREPHGQGAPPSSSATAPVLAASSAPAAAQLRPETPRITTGVHEARLTFASAQPPGTLVTFRNATGHSVSKELAREGPSTRVEGLRQDELYSVELSTGATATCRTLFPYLHTDAALVHEIAGHRDTDMRMATDGERVWLQWRCRDPAGGKTVVLRESPDGGRTWGADAALVRRTEGTDSPRLVRVAGGLLTGFTTSVVGKLAFRPDDASEKEQTHSWAANTEGLFELAAGPGGRGEILYVERMVKELAPFFDEGAPVSWGRYDPEASPPLSLQPVTRVNWIIEDCRLVRSSSRAVALFELDGIISGSGDVLRYCGSATPGSGEWGPPQPLTDESEDVVDWDASAWAETVIVAYETNDTIRVRTSKDGGRSFRGPIEPAESVYNLEEPAVFSDPRGHLLAHLETLQLDGIGSIPALKILRSSDGQMWENEPAIVQRLSAGADFLSVTRAGEGIVVAGIDTVHRVFVRRFEVPPR